MKGARKVRPQALLTKKESKPKEIIEDKYEGPDRIPSAADENLNDAQRVIRAPVEHMPSNHPRRWTQAELAILGQIKEEHGHLTFKAQYELYQTGCKRLGIPDRSMVSVRLKLSRI